jgi:hypothetical protein
MKKTSAVVVALLFIILVGLNVYQYFRYNQLEENSPIQISELKGEDRESFIGKIITVEGYLAFIANEYPILVANIDFLLIDAKIPDDQFVELVIRDFEKYENAKGAFVHAKGKIIEGEDDIRLDIATIKTITVAVHPYDDLLITEPIPWDQIAVSRNSYAVLISGGINPLNAHNRYWNDIKYMYQILNNTYGYNPDNIYVIYKDGVAEDNDIPVHFSATITNVNTVFNQLANTLTARDSLFIYLNNHGGGFNPNAFPFLYDGLVDTDGDEPDVGYFETNYGIDIDSDGNLLETFSIDEVLWLYYDQMMSDDDLANLLDDIVCNQMIIFMKQCFSGGFIHDLSGSNRIILSACGEEEFAWGADTEGEYGEFSYHFMKAVNGEDWTADVNNDNKISMVEAFNYASNKDSQPETPHYDDNGDAFGHTASIPKGGDGNIGANTFP